jgi:putative tryptophan/tyrosine transport system substrate-binding protein
MARFFISLALTCLVNMTLVLEVAAAPRVWVALAEEGGAHAEVAAVLQPELADQFEVSVATWQTLFDGKTAMPDLIVTVGVAALDGTLERLAKKDVAWARIPVLATLLPQTVFDARMAAGPVVQRPFSAAVLDQPLGRQMALIKRALPRRQLVGVLVGAQTRPLLDGLEKEARARGLMLMSAPTIGAPEMIYPALKLVLNDAEVILALPDPMIYHGASLQNILLTTYRARVPLVAFSPAYVKAGAVLAVYSTPTQVARRAVEMIGNWLAGRGLPPPQMPREFSVMANSRVAASLGLQIDDPAAIAEDLRRQEGGR